MPNQFNIYYILEKPFIYKLSQHILAPGAEKNLARRLKELTKLYSVSGRIIDIGCGPSSWLWKINAFPFGLDISYSYSSAYHDQQKNSINGSAMALPFKADSFDGAWSIGVLHHLPDSAAKEAIQEMLRICRPGGYVVILDAVLPKNKWTRPLATFIRRMDRGKFMRSQKQLRSLLPENFNWSMQRYTYADTCLEMLECTCFKPLNQRLFE